jgi:hydrogenase nickel incorporation protein HypA/HybF
MHELSIASSILDLARRHMPDGTVLRSVKIRVGPMRGIEPQAMEFAWRACTQGSSAEKTLLELESIPWRLHCSRCGTEFDSVDLYTACACGASQVHPVGGDELLLVSIEVDEPSAAIPFLGCRP